MSRPDYTNPPPHYQVMTIGQARREYAEDLVFTLKDFCQKLGLEDGHWCYMQSNAQGQRVVVVKTTLNEEGSGRFEAYEDACRMAWYSYLQREMEAPTWWTVLVASLASKTPTEEIDRLVESFQKRGTL